MKKVITIVLIILLVASFIGTGYFLYKKSEKPAEVFETEKPFYTDIVKKTVATGTINTIVITFFMVSFNY
jgi:HlyD family secretion protein